MGRIEDFEFVERPKENVVLLNSPLGGKFGEYILNEKYFPLVKEKYGSHPSLLGIKKNYFSHYLENFNLYKAVLMDEVVRGETKASWNFRLRGMKIEDLHRLHEDVEFYFNSHEYFLGAVLRGEDEPKQGNAKRAISQLEEMSKGSGELVKVKDPSPLGRDYSLLETPVYFSLSDLEIEINDNYSKGIGIRLRNCGENYLEFKEGEGANIRDFRGGKINLGFPRSPVSFRRTKSGFSKVVLKGYSVLDSGDGSFTNTIPNSYFVLVKEIINK